MRTPCLYAVCVVWGRYKGYELDPQSWLGADVEQDLHNLAALDEWERLGPAKYRRLTK